MIEKHLTFHGKAVILLIMVNLQENIKPMSYLRNHSTAVVQQVTTDKKTMVITSGGEAKMVLLDIGIYQEMMDTISLLRLLSFGENDAKNSRFCSTEELDAKVARILES
jgi:PHD/YefM family antitoxin component YafN of YafNO toxin-antitoxin module